MGQKTMMAQKLKSLFLFRRAMMWLNTIIVLYISAIFYGASVYIVNHNFSYQFLNQLNRIPFSPVAIFWTANLTMLLLATIMTIRHHSSHSVNSSASFFIIEILLSIIIYIALQTSYNGLFLLILVDYFLFSRNMAHIYHLPFWVSISLLFLLLYSVSDYAILGSFLNMPNLTSYISFLPVKIRTKLVIIKNFLTTLNLLCFIGIIAAYGLYLLNQDRNIQEELSQAARTNLELKNYAALSEKIAQNRERKRIARDIHDTVGHALTGISAGVDATKMLIDINPQAAKEQLDKISVATKQGIKDVRKTLNQMRPGALNGYTLEASLKKMLQEYSDISHLQINFRYEWQQPDFEKTTENVIFRIIEEAITNSLRHGHASKVNIYCLETPAAYLLNIQDNGTGVKMIRPGFGITQMKERVAIINGKITFDGSQGFLVSVMIPKKQ
ncbi:sensor histidine kinase [Lactobacillus delbrueckii]|nr:sensor histidine kinase [Lactobacillus delbrueckii]